MDRRAKELEALLTDVAGMIAELRARFQDLAVEADERLGKIESALGRPAEPR